MARKPFPHQVERAKDLLGLIHTDVCGSFRIVSREGASYFITFTDDFSRYGYVYLMKYKHEVFEAFKVFQNEVENQLGKKFKAIRSDRGGEYLSHEGYALESIARILNMVPTKKVDRTSYKIWHGKDPKLSYLRIPKGTMGYYFYYPLENKICFARNDEFFENNLILQEASGSHELLEASRVPNGEVLLRRSGRSLSSTDRYCIYVDAEEHELEDFNEPPNYKATLSDLEFDKWLDAMNTGMQSMRDNQVWGLVDLPPNG
ncbi:retrotransposon protein, putative, ty1-copia subclass [Tanacetum coccineum]